MVLASARGCRTSPPARAPCCRAARRLIAASTSSPSTRTSMAPCRWSATRGGLDDARRRRSAATRAPGVAARTADASAELERRPSRPRRRRATRALPSDAAGDRRGQPRRAGRRDIVVCAAGGLPGELHKLWRARAPGGYHLEYGYLLHGLRDRRRARRQAGAPRARGHRDGRRRHLSDDELRARDLGDAGHEAHHRRARQPRLRLHQPAAAGDRRRELQQPAATSTTADETPGRFRRPRARLGALAEKVAASPSWRRALERARAADRTR